MRVTENSKDVAGSALHMMSSMDPVEFERLIHPAATNREAKDEPPDCRGVGPEALMATARWLHTAFSDLRWEVLDAVAEGDTVVLHATMQGVHTGPFVAYGEDARPKVVFPPTGRSFKVTQSHWWRLAEGQVIEHWANRDDQGMAEQLGWTPPSPVYLARMLLALRRAKAAA